MLNEIDNFHNALEEADEYMEDFLQNYMTDIIELFETGSAEIALHDKKFLIAIVIQEVKED
jgi:hypothetical protein